MSEKRRLIEKTYLLFFVGGLGFALDIVTKYLVKANMSLSESIPLLGEYVKLTFIYNEGAAFGISLGEHSNLIFLVLSSFATLLIISYYYLTPKELLCQRIGLAMICGGAIGNLFDRILFGKVTDFVECGYGRFTWPIFNVADMAVTIGAILFAITYLRRSDKNDLSISSAAQNPSGTS